jgi:hypothetical protein
MDTKAWRDECQIQYKSRQVVEERAKLLRDLRLQKEEGIERSTDDVTFQDLLVGKTSGLQYSIGELLAAEPDIYTLASQIAETLPGAALAIEKRVRKLAKAIVKLFDGSVKIDALAGYEFAEVTKSAQDWANEVLQHHRGLIVFLCLFDSRCSAEAPQEKAYDGPVHTVHIEDLNTILVDGAPLPMNRARKGALFALAIMGTSDISVEGFARLYNDELYRHPGTAANYANIFLQAISGLRKSLPHLAFVRSQPHLRSINGLMLTCAVARDALEWWLRHRTDMI